jgi:hypothetical protein
MAPALPPAPFPPGAPPHQGYPPGYAPQEQGAPGPHAMQVRVFFGANGRVGGWVCLRA